MEVCVKNRAIKFVNKNKCAHLLFVISSCFSCLVSAQTDTFAYAPWYSEMKCESLGLPFGNLTAISGNEGSSDFGDGVRTTSLEWSGGSPGNLSLVYISDHKRIVLRTQKVFENLPFNLSELSGHQNPSASSVGFSLPRLSYAISSSSQEKQAVAKFLGFPSDWKINDYKETKSGNYDKKRVVFSIYGSKNDGESFSLMCGGIFSLPGFSMGTIDKDLQLDGFDVFDPPVRGGKRLGKIRYKKTLSEWQEESR